MLGKKKRHSHKREMEEYTLSRMQFRCAVEEFGWKHECICVEQTNTFPLFIDVGISKASSTATSTLLLFVGFSCRDMVESTAFASRVMQAINTCTKYRCVIVDKTNPVACFAAKTESMDSIGRSIEGIVRQVMPPSLPSVCCIMSTRNANLETSVRNICEAMNCDPIAIGSSGCCRRPSYNLHLDDQNKLLRILK